MSSWQSQKTLGTHKRHRKSFEGSQLEKLTIAPVTMPLVFLELVVKRLLEVLNRRRGVCIGNNSLSNLSVGPISTRKITTNNISTSNVTTNNGRGEVSK